MGDSAHGSSAMVLDRGDFSHLLEALARRGYRVIGPTIRQGAVVYDEIDAVSDLPAGWTDERQAGRYRLKRRADGALFGFGPGPHSCKNILYPPLLRLWKAKRTDAGFEVSEDGAPPGKLALLGVRSCDLHAVAIQDRTFLHGKYIEPHYQARREGMFVVAVNCNQAGGTCFCASMGTGPEVNTSCDIVLSELTGEPAHRFILEAGSTRGAEVLTDLPGREVHESDRLEAQRAVATARAQMGRMLDTSGIRELLCGSYEHPAWEEVATRCLACTNCTIVCPTCFCHTIHDTSDLQGTSAERWRKWDSCYTLEFSYIHGSQVRSSAMARYRQWLIHKLATWIDQFGCSGCVGCGRCITWCPVGIDLTEQVETIRRTTPPKVTTTPPTKGTSHDKPA